MRSTYFEKAVTTVALLGIGQMNTAAQPPGTLAATLAANSAAMNVAEPFHDVPLVAGATLVKAVHVTELRTRIDALRGRRHLAPYPYTQAIAATTTVIQATDILEMRTALAAVYTALAMPQPVYSTSPAIGTPILTADIQDLRNAVTAID